MRRQDHRPYFIDGARLIVLAENVGDAIRKLSGNGVFLETAVVEPGDPEDLLPESPAARWLGR